MSRVDIPRTPRASSCISSFRFGISPITPINPRERKQQNHSVPSYTMNSTLRSSSSHSYHSPYSGSNGNNNDIDMRMSGSRQSQRNASAQSYNIKKGCSYKRQAFSSPNRKGRSLFDYKEKEHNSNGVYSRKTNSKVFSDPSLFSDSRMMSSTTLIMPTSTNFTNISSKEHKKQSRRRASTHKTDFNSLSRLYEPKPKWRRFGPNGSNTSGKSPETNKRITHNALRIDANDNDDIASCPINNITSNNMFVVNRVDPFKECESVSDCYLESISVSQDHDTISRRSESDGVSHNDYTTKQNITEFIHLNFLDSIIHSLIKEYKTDFDRRSSHSSNSRGPRSMSLYQSLRSDIPTTLSGSKDIPYKVPRVPVNHHTPSHSVSKDDVFSLISLPSDDIEYICKLCQCTVQELADAEKRYYKRREISAAKQRQSQIELEDIKIPQLYMNNSNSICNSNSEAIVKTPSLPTSPIVHSNTRNLRSILQHTKRMSGNNSKGKEYPKVVQPSKEKLSTIKRVLKEMLLMWPNMAALQCLKNINFDTEKDMDIQGTCINNIFSSIDDRSKGGINVHEFVEFGKRMPDDYAKLLTEDIYYRNVSHDDPHGMGIITLINLLFPEVMRQPRLHDEKMRATTAVRPWEQDWDPTDLARLKRTFRLIDYRDRGKISANDIAAFCMGSNIVVPSSCPFDTTGLYNHLSISSIAHVSISQPLSIPRERHPALTGEEQEGPLRLNNIDGVVWEGVGARKQSVQHYGGPDITAFRDHISQYDSDKDGYVTLREFADMHKPYIDSRNLREKMKLSSDLMAYLNEDNEVINHYM